MNKPQTNVFFASQNSCEGFKSHFDAIFSEDCLDTLYIIKGGPGTGKSHLMKSIAGKWEKSGARVERFLCSSDPDSLDGILNRDKKIAVIDGTAPHTADAKYPGCVGRIVFTGSFWDEERLKEKTDAIRELSGKKEKSYACAYAFLRALSSVKNCCVRIAAQGFNKEKMRMAAKRFAAKELGGKGGGARETRLTASFNKNGLMRLRSFEKLAQRRCLVCDKYFTGHLFLQELLKLTDQEVVCSYSPLDPEKPDGLYFPNLSLCVVCDKKEDWEKEFSQADRYINMERFLNEDAVRSNRQKLRFAAKCAASLAAGAKDAFQKAAQIHAQIEEFYVNSMNFEALSAFEKDMIQKLC